MTGVTWLHLSDWHQKGKDFDRKAVREKLIKDIRNREAISKDLAKIDFVVFSGDLAFSGKQEEYQTAKRELLEPLLEACKLEPSCLFIVPGNHDIERDKIKLLPKQLISPLKSCDEANDWLFDKEKRVIALRPFSNFKNFVQRYTRQNSPDYANIYERKIDGKKITLLGLNSAWMCGRRKKIKK
jgi:predicted MPP superfamily phosphohydrolase